MKKQLIALGLMAAVTSVGAVAKSTTELEWTGKVGSGIASDDYMITGIGGSTASDDLKGELLNVTSGAQFESSSIVLELRENTGTSASPIPGLLWNDASEINGTAVGSVDITWTVEYANGWVTGTAGSQGQDLETMNSGVNPIVVSLDYSAVAVGANTGSQSDNNVGVTVANHTQFPVADVAGKDITVTVGISAVAV